MLKQKMPTRELAKTLSEEISTPIYDALCELHRADAERRNNGEIAPSDPIKTREEIVIDAVEDFLDRIEDYKTLKIASLSSADFDYIRDTIINEYADNSAEIYNYWLWQHAPILSEFIEDSIIEFCDAESVIKDRGLIGLLIQGEYFFYEKLAYEIVNALENYLNNK